MTAIKRVTLDSDRSLLTFGSAGSNLYGVVYTNSTATFGTPVLIRTSAGNHIAIKTTTDQALVCSCNTTTGFGAVVLSISGSTITVNTGATATNGANVTANGFHALIAVGSAWVVGYNCSGPSNQIRSLSISGTTVTISTNEVALDGTANTFIYLAAASSSVMLAVSLIASTSLRTNAYTISGSADPVVGTGTTTNLAAITNYRILPMSGGATWGVVYMNTGSTALSASVISVDTGTVTSTLSSVASFIATGGAFEPLTAGDMIVAGSKLIFATTTTAGSLANILTDTSGSASAGTAIGIVASANTNAISAAANNARFMGSSSTAASVINLDYSGASPVLTSGYTLAGGTNVWSALSAPFFSGVRNTGMLVGAQTFAVAAQTSTVGARVPRMIGTVLDAPPTQFIAPTSFAAAATLTAPGSRSNESWSYVANFLAPATVAQVARVESVT